MPLAFRKVNLGFWLAFVLLIAIGLISFHSTTSLLRAGDARAHARALLIELEATHSILKDAETGQRGYLLTGEDRYLKPYQTRVWH